jgi:hypothetical protein
MQYWRGRIFSNQRLGMTVYNMIVMMTVLDSKLCHIKNLILKSTMFPHRNIHKYTWTSPGGRTYNQIDHILIGRRWHSSILDVRPFRWAECDADHCLVVAKVRERSTVCKQAAQKFDEERFNLRKLNKLEVRKQYQIEITHKFAALESLSDGEEV